MHTLKDAIAIAWVLFWAYWLVAGLRAKRGVSGRRSIPFPGLGILAVVLLLRVMRNGNLGVQSPVLGAIGAVMFAIGIAFAIWARVHLGRNWGMPMTRKAEPELVTSGPYRLVRHPIYTGILLAMFGTALVTSLASLVIVAVLIAYFYYAASVEERNLAATFPTTYPPYKADTKMLIPFVL